MNIGNREIRYSQCIRETPCCKCKKDISGVDGYILVRAEQRGIWYSCTFNKKYCMKCWKKAIKLKIPTLKERIEKNERLIKLALLRRMK